jgi:hypothetical protein
MELGCVLIADHCEWQTCFELRTYFEGRTEDIQRCLVNDHFNFLLVGVPIEFSSFGYEPVRNQCFFEDCAKHASSNFLIIYLANQSADVENSQHYAVESERDLVGGNGAFVAHRDQSHSGPGWEVGQHSDVVLPELFFGGLRHRSDPLEVFEVLADLGAGFVLFHTLKIIILD